MKIAAMLLLLFVVFSGHVTGQEREIYNLPAWLILEYGRKAYGERELGVALRYAREALEKKGHFFPEAEILIGDVFDAEGNEDLAIRQYEKALEMSKQLYVLSEKYEILYKLGDIYEDRDPEAHEQTLLMILEDDEMFQQAIRTDLGAKMINMLLAEGFDKLLTLYRLQSYHSLEAHSSLGMLYFAKGEYEKAVLHLLFSITTVFSRCIEEYKTYDPEYVYEDAGELLQLTKRYDAIQEFLDITNLYMNLFFLGKTMIPLGAEEGFVRELWEICVNHSGDDTIVNFIREELDNLEKQ